MARSARLIFDYGVPLSGMFLKNPSDIPVTHNYRWLTWKIFRSMSDDELRQ